MTAAISAGSRFLSRACWRMMSSWRSGRVISLIASSPGRSMRRRRRPDAEHEQQVRSAGSRCGLRASPGGAPSLARAPRACRRSARRSRHDPPSPPVRAAAPRGRRARGGHERPPVRSRRPSSATIATVASNTPPRTGFEQQRHLDDRYLRPIAAALQLRAPLGHPLAHPREELSLEPGKLLGSRRTRSRRPPRG